MRTICGNLKQLFSKKLAKRAALQQSGQIFSLDVLISLGIAIVALGILLQAHELQSYARKDSSTELWQNAYQAAENLVGSQQVACKLLLDYTEQKLDNCIIRSKTISAKQIGISANEFGCSVEGLEVDGCTDNAPLTATNIAAVERVVVFADADLSKTDFESCLTGNKCLLSSPQKIRLKLWRPV